MGERRRSRAPGLGEIVFGLVLGLAVLAWAYWDTEPPAPVTEPLGVTAPADPAAPASGSAPVPTVVYVTYGANPLMNPIRDGFLARLAALGSAPRIVELDGAGEPGAPLELADRVRDMSDVAVVVAVTTAIAVPVTEGVRGLTPVVFAAVSDPVGSGLVPSLDNAAGSGVTGSSDRCTVDAQLAFVRELFPDAHRLGFLHGELTERVPPLPIEDAASLGLTLVPVETRVLTDLPRAERALAQGRIDVLLVHPNWAADYAVYAGFPALARDAVERGWPLVLADEPNVHRGGLAGMGSDLGAAGAAAADATVAILQGADPGSIPVAQLPCAPPVVNRSVADALGFVIPPSVALRARYVTTDASAEVPP